MCLDASRRRYDTMDNGQEELQQVWSWLHEEEGLAPDASKEAQLCVLWRCYQHTRGQLGRLTRQLDAQRSQHAAETAEVRRSLEQIRSFTETKNALAQEIQDENQQLKEQLRRLVSLQDAQISEVAKMLYQQGLTELIHSSPSEQVAYLLVERASLLETSREEDVDHLTATAGPPGAEPQRPQARQSPHKAAPRHGPWKRLFGLHKASQGKHTLSAVEAGAVAASAASVERKCSRLELDLEEGSRRLAMAHSEIRRLTDELESAHMTQRTYEPELQEAQQEVEQLRQQVEKLKKYEMMELRKAKELNERLDFEIRALRNRVRALDAHNQTLQHTVKAAEATRSRETSGASEEELASQAEARLEREEMGVRLQMEVQWLEAELEEQRQQLEEAQLQLRHSKLRAQLQAEELAQREELCRGLEAQLSAQGRSITEEEVGSPGWRLRGSGGLTAAVWTHEDRPESQQQQKAAESADVERSGSRDSAASQLKEPNEESRQRCRGACLEAAQALEAARAESQALKLEICETLKSLDEERSKSHQKKEKYKWRRCRAEQQLAEETTRRDERIKQLERELALSAHSLAKEKELVRSVTAENEKLLGERRCLLQKLSHEEHSNQDHLLTAARANTRVDFLEMENKKLGNKILHMSKQQVALERILQNMQNLQLAEDLRKISKAPDLFGSLPSSVKTPASLWESAPPAATSPSSSSSSYPHALISAALSRSAEMGYLNLTSARRHPDPPDPASDNLC